MHAIYGMWRRTGAMGLATVIAGALLLGSPAAATAADGKQPTTPGLEAALARDLQLSPAEFDARGELAKIASQALPKLKQIDGFAGIRLSAETPARLLIAGSGEELERAVAELAARAEVEAEVVSLKAFGQEPDSAATDGTTAAPSTSVDAPAPEITSGATAGTDPSSQVVPSDDVSASAPTPRPTASPTKDPSTGSAPKAPSKSSAEAPASGSPETSSSDTTEPAEADSPDTPPSDGPDTTAEPATSATALLNDYIEAYGKAALSRLQSIMQNGEGEFVIRMDAPRQQLRSAAPDSAPAPDSFASAYTNVEIAQADGPADALAHIPSNPHPHKPSDPRPHNPSDPLARDATAPVVHDLVGGLGTLTQNAEYVSVCSVGFNAFSPTGEHAAFSAGHCTMDGQFEDVFLTDPTKDRASRPGASNPEKPLNLQYPQILTELGTYTFSQFGSTEKPTGTPAENVPATNAGTDVAVISNINDRLEQLPAVTNWKTPADPAASGPLVLGKTKPVIDTPVCKSGRTTGWTCGEIDAIGVFLVAGPNFATDPTDVRVVQGFGSFDLYSATGDSGGAMITGNYALGVLSAGGGSTEGSLVTFGASIGPMLNAAKGYTLQVFVQPPQMRSHNDGGTAQTGELISGAAPAGSDIRVTSGGKKLNVTVEPDGDWSFHAPEEAGVFTFSITASKGFSTSETIKYQLIIEEPPPPAPEKDGPKPDREVVPAGGQPPAPLADTGVAVDPMMFGFLGGGLLVAGLLLLLTGRRSI